MADVQHPEPDDLMAFAGGELESARREAIDAHIDVCSACADVIVALAGAYEASRAELALTVDQVVEAADVAHVDNKLERFHILEEVGRGAMGVVFAAYDPDLDRRVALKVLRRRATPDDAADVRFLREAQAMARLTHPNAITVHEARMVDGRLYISMEFVEGHTLAGWLRQKERSWSEVLGVFVQIASGLAAAHAAGLVHRDIKPDNVLVGNDGRVRVTDFGLARPLRIGHEDHDSSQPTLDALATELTRTGMLVGTPAYMAPEQLRGEPADAASDQFAYCVAFHEALFGARPFAGKRLADLTANVLGDRRSEPPAERTVPKWLRQVISRGLAPDPAARHPSMDALLQALVRGDRAPQRRRQLGAVVAALAIGGVSTLALGSIVAPACSGLEQRRRVADCEHAAAELDDTWNDAKRDEVRTAFVATGLGYADVTADRVVAELDRFAAEWIEVRRDTCVNAVEQASALLFDAATVECLHDRRAELEALIDSVLAPDDALVQEAVPAAALLPRPSLCADAGWLARRARSGPDGADVRALRGRLRRAEALHGAGRHDEALALARAVEAEAGALEQTSLRIAASWRIGVVLASKSDFEGAASTLDEAFLAAWQAGEDVLAADVARSMVHVSSERARFDDAMRWAAIARSTYDRVGEPEDSLPRAYLASAVAGAHELRGEFDAARVELERALAIEERVLGPEHVGVGKTLGNIGVLLANAGAVDDARVMFERVLAIYEPALGPEHPSVASALLNLGGTLFASGDLEGAQSCLERALRLREQTFGPDHADVADVLNNLGNVHLARGEHAKALECHERNERIVARIHGDAHPRVATASANIANVLYSRGDLEGAEQKFRRALAIYERSSGARHPSVASTRSNLGNVLISRGRYAEALAEFEAALAIFTDVAPDHPHLGFTLLGLGDCLLALDRAAQAVPFLERYVAHAEQHGEDEATIAKARSSLAQARLRAGD